MDKIKKIIFCLFVIAAIFLVGCSKQNNFGPHGSTHDHADFKVFILGKALNFNGPGYQVMDRLTHVEGNDGNVLHIHATGITLGFFLETLGMQINNECLTLDTGNQYCNLGSATLKVFVQNGNSDWIQIYSPADYVINHLDKIFVSYGTETDEEIKTQQGQVTDRAQLY